MRVNYAGGRRRDWRQEAAVRHLGQRRECGLQDGFYGRVGRDSSHPGGARYSDHQGIPAHLSRGDPGQREGQYDNILPGRPERRREVESGGRHQDEFQQQRRHG